MNYCEYKNTWNEMADNVKELTTFEERLKHAEMKQLEKKITEFIRVLNCVVKIVQQ